MWEASQRELHERHWPAVERLLAGLPPGLSRLAKPHEYDLAYRHAASGRFEAIFQGPTQLPLLSLGPWLLTDLADAVGRDGAPEAAGEPDAIERGLFLGGVLLALRTQAIVSLVDETSFSDGSQLHLVAMLSERATRELMCLLPVDSTFWARHEAISLASEEEELAARERWSSGAGSGVELAPRAGPWALPARIAAVAAATLAGREDLSGPLASLVGDLATSFQVRHELETMHADLLAGRSSYPIALVARSAGVPDASRVTPEVILGALLATHALPTILDAAGDSLDRCRAEASGLGLDLLVGYLGSAGEALRAERERIAGGSEPRRGAAADRHARRVAPQTTRPLMRRARPILPAALDMADRYLLADATLRESWETHREGMLGSDEVASRFPAGLVLEILAREGLPVSGRIDDFLAFTASNGFRYYDHPSSGPDSDTVGVYLRLVPLASHPSVHGAALRPILDCLERSVLERSQVPVWITGCEDAAGGDDGVALGEGCGTVAAHLLLGLLGSPAHRDRAMVTVGSEALLGRIAATGLGANVDYPPMYALGVFLRLVAARQAEPLGEARGPLEEARAILEGQLARLVAGMPRSAQAAALATLACREAGRADLLDRSWLLTILKAQRSDGSWSGEPFAAAPNRGGWVSWYASTTLTSALCREALGHFATRAVS